MGRLDQQGPPPSAVSAFILNKIEHKWNFFKIQLEFCRLAGHLAIG